RLGTGAVCTLAGSALALLQPWPLKIIVDNVLRGKPLNVPWLPASVATWSSTQLLDAAIIAFIVLLVVGALLDYAGTYLMDASGIRMVADVREALFARLQRHS